MCEGGVDKSIRDLWRGTWYSEFWKGAQLCAKELVGDELGRSGGGFDDAVGEATVRRQVRLGLGIFGDGDFDL